MAKENYFIVTKTQVHTTRTQFNVSGADAKAAQAKVETGKAGSGKALPDSMRTGYQTRVDFERMNEAEKAERAES